MISRMGNRSIIQLQQRPNGSSFSTYVYGGAEA